MATKDNSFLFLPNSSTLDFLTESHNWIPLNYRLSTPPPLPQFSQFTKSQDPGRDVKLPAYLNDVIAGLKHPQRTYGVRGNYILVGHSCGATLTF